LTFAAKASWSGLQYGTNAISVVPGVPETRPRKFPPGIIELLRLHNTEKEPVLQTTYVIENAVTFFAMFCVTAVLLSLTAAAAAVAIQHCQMS
jgi:hypothetical protein